MLKFNREPRKVKPSVAFFAMEQTARDMVPTDDIMRTQVYQLGEGVNAAWCLMQFGGKGPRFYAEDGKWHLPSELLNAPVIA